MGGALAKLNWKHWAIIGVLVCAIIGASLFFLLIKKQQEQLAAKQAEFQKVEAKAKELPQAREDLRAAKAERDAAMRRLAVYERTKMIPLSVNTEVDRFHTMVRLWHEQAEVLGPLMERHIGSTGVRVPGATAVFANLATGQQFEASIGSRVISVPRPPDRPEAINPGWYRIPLGTIQIETTKGFPQVLSFLRSFTRAPRLVTVGAPSITGTSPNLRVSVPIEAYYLVKGSAPAAAGGGAPGEPGMDPAMAGPGDPAMAGPGDPGMPPEAP